VEISGDFKKAVALLSQITEKRIQLLGQVKKRLATEIRWLFTAQTAQFKIAARTDFHKYVEGADVSVIIPTTEFTDDAEPPQLKPVSNSLMCLQ
jgi:threonine synthase